MKKEDGMWLPFLLLPSLSCAHSLCGPSAVLSLFLFLEALISPLESELLNKAFHGPEL